MTKMHKKELVCGRSESLMRICKILNCTLSDMVDVVQD